MPRKRYKLKKHSCAMCKAYKMHGAVRWEPLEMARRQEFERLEQFDWDDDDPRLYRYHHRT